MDDYLKKFPYRFWKKNYGGISEETHKSFSKAFFCLAKILEDPLTNIPKEILEESMEDVMKIFSKKPVENFPKGLEEDFLMEFMQVFLWSSSINFWSKL